MRAARWGTLILITCSVLVLTGCYGLNFGPVQVVAKDKLPSPKGPVGDPTAPGGPWTGPPPSGAGGAYGPPGALSEHIAQVSARLQTSEDDKRILHARVRQLENQLKDKDRALVQAAHEIDEAIEQVGHTRDELKRWKAEMETLRTKLRNVEKDNKTTLEAILRTLEQFMEKERTRAPEVGEKY